jgi:hypothetical protein
MDRSLVEILFKEKKVHYVSAYTHDDRSAATHSHVSVG